MFGRHRKPDVKSVRPLPPEEAARLPVRRRRVWPLVAGLTAGAALLVLAGVAVLRGPGSMPGARDSVEHPRAATADEKAPPATAPELAPSPSAIRVTAMGAPGRGVRVQLPHLFAAVAPGVKKG